MIGVPLFEMLRLDVICLELPPVETVVLSTQLGMFTGQTHHVNN